MIKALRGMKDLTFEESRKFIYIIDKAVNIAKNYGYEYIETPILEETKLFKRSVGESSDIVGKEMYQFIDKGNNDVCMRPEGTAGVVRSFIQAKLDRRANERFRFYYYGAMFRYERPQKGRLREFHQFGCESFGEDSVYEDFTNIQMISDIFNSLNIKFSIKINSLGCKECMPIYRDNLVKFLDGYRDNLCEDCNRRVNTNPIRVLDCKNSGCKDILKKSPKLIDNLCESCNSDFNRLVSLLELNGIDFEVDTNLVRGLDYYNKTAFEFISRDIGAQSAIAGGGRYDRLVEFLGGKSTPAVGFAIGIERIMDIVKLPNINRDGYYMGVLDEVALDKIIPLAHKKREDYKVFLEYKPKKLKAHLKGADRANARYCVVIGEDELKSGSVWIKDLELKEESIKKMENL